MGAADIGYMASTFKQMHPYVSAILVAGRQRQRAQRALQGLLGQDGGEDLEILLLDRENTFSPLRGSTHPRVRTLPLLPDQSFISARIAAIREARGEVVAFVEEHACTLPGWLLAIKQAFKTGGWSGVGCEMHNANPGQGISNAVALLNYLIWTPPAVPGPSRMLPGHNSAYRRAALLSFEEELPMLLQSEVLLQWRLWETGRQLAIIPEARIAHLNEGRLTTICRGYYLWNRCFGCYRARVYRWPLVKKLAWVLGAPLIPFIRLGKSAGLLRKYPERFLRLLLYWPVWLVAWSAASLGQATGIVLGPGNAERLFTDYELNTPRPEPCPHP